MSLLHEAVRKNDKAAVLRTLKKEGKQAVNRRDGYGQTPLHLASYEGHVELVGLLLAKGADVQVLDKNGWSPLHSAATSGEFLISKMLIEKGADVNSNTQTGTSPLHYLVASSTDEDPKIVRSVLELMLEKGANLNAQTNYGETPLFQACMRRRVENVAFLIEKGADVNATARSGETSLHFAARIGQMDVVNMLLKAGADPNVAGVYGTCLDVAKATNQLEVLEVLRKAVEGNGNRRKKEANEKKNSEEMKRALVKVAPPVPAPAHKNEAKTYGIAFGIKRGGCDAPCKCTVYSPEDAERGGPCQTCGHFPIKHKFLGKASDDDPDPPQEDHVRNTVRDREGEEAKALLAKGATWTVAATELSFGEKLGVGTSAEVFKGTYRGQEVAIKVLKPLLDPKQIENFKKELDIMGQLRSPRVVYFFGMCLEPKICIVMEYCARGSLYHVLQQKNINIDWPLVFHLADGAVRGILTLHSWKPAIVHRDLKSLNLLVDDSWAVKVCDFGLSRFTDTGNLSTLGKLRGTFAYCAPEVYFGERFSVKSDVYSLGVIFWELVVRCMKGQYERPYGEYKHLVFDFQIIIQTAKKGLRPTLPSACPTSFTELITRCWAAEADHRPDCVEIAALLDKMRKDYEADPAPWDSLRVVQSGDASPLLLAAPPPPASTSSSTGEDASVVPAAVSVSLEQPQVPAPVLTSQNEEVSISDEASSEHQADNDLEDGNMGLDRTKKVDKKAKKKKAKSKSKHAADPDRKDAKKKKAKDT